MSRLRPLVAVLATLAALVGAPLSVFGAAPGTSSPGAVSPTGGMTATVSSLGAAYDNTGAWPSADAARVEETEPTQIGHDLLVTVLFAGLVGIAAVALIGTGVLIATRPPRKREPEPPSDPQAVAVPIIEQRALRRARMRLTHDPILGALGLEDDDEKPMPSAPGQRGQKGRR